MPTMDARQGKLFIKVDGVIGDRKRICTFCNNTIEGAEKVVETTRKLRHGPYFPQLAYLQSAVGKIDTLGRAVVCLPCFHQLLRQWSTYEQRKIPVSRRTYKYVSDKGVKNYDQTKAFQIRNEAEKRAFAVHTKQDHIVKESFAKLNKLLDIEEELVRRSEERIIKLRRELADCSKGEHWRINREIRKHEEVIKAAERRIEEEEDKEEKIRNETKALLKVYRENNSLFRSASEPNLLSINGRQNFKTLELDVDYLSENQVESSQLRQEFLDTVDGSSLTMNRNSKFDGQYNSNGFKHRMVRTTVERDVVSDDEIDGYDCHIVKHDGNDANHQDVWSSLERSTGFLKGNQTATNSPSEWHLVKEIIHPAQSEVQSVPGDVWSKLEEQQHETENVLQLEEVMDRNEDWDRRNDAHSEDNMMQKKTNMAMHRENHGWQETYSDNSEEEDEKTYEVNPREWSSQADIDRCHVRERIHDYQDGMGTIDQKKSDEVKSSDAYRIPSNDFTDPWDNIHMENEKEKLKNQPSGNGQTNDNDFSDEYDQEMAYTSERGIHSPGRLGSDRFREFSKSSYAPQSVRSPKHYKNSPEQTVDIRSSKTEGKVIEQSSIPEQNERNVYERNGFAEYQTNTRNLRERHLSVQEEEWETKHLNPKRLDQSKWFNLLNETSDDNDKIVEAKPTITVRENNSDYLGNNFTQYSDTRSTPNSEQKQGELNVERSPALRKLMRKDETGVSERPSQRFLKRDPGDHSQEIDRRTVIQSSYPQNNTEQVFNEPSFDNNVRVGRIDLQRWSSDVSDVKRNRILQPSGDSNTSNRDLNERRFNTYVKQDSFTGENTSQTSEVVIISRNQSPKKCGDMFVLEKTNEDSATVKKRGIANWKYSGKVSVSNENDPSYEETPVSPRLKNYSETVVLEEQDSRQNGKLSDPDRKRVGKINLSLWEQSHGSSHPNTNGTGYTSKTSSVIKTRSPPFSPTNKNSSEVKNERNSSKCQDGDRSTCNNNLSQKPRIVTLSQENRSSNTSRSSSNLNSSYSLNQSMTEDELAWEKKFTKSYRNYSSDEDSEDWEIQRNVPDSRSPRLLENDQNENYLNFGRIVLNEDEVRRVRNVGNNTNKRTEETKNSPRTTIGYNKMEQKTSHIAFSATNQNERTNYSTISQLTEEEQAWEEKTSSPGKLDFSKFSHFR